MWGGVFCLLTLFRKYMETAWLPSIPFVSIDIHMMAFADYKLMGSCSSCPCALMSPSPALESRFGCWCSPGRVVVLQGRVCRGLWGLGSTTAAGRSALTLLGAGLESSAGTLADSGAHCSGGGCPGLREEKWEMNRAVLFDHLL